MAYQFVIRELDGHTYYDGSNNVNETIGSDHFDQISCAMFFDSEEEALKAMSNTWISYYEVVKIYI